MSAVLDPLSMPLSGVHSINASAGTGKTFTITTLYLRYLLEARCAVDQILVTTFTEAATAELKDRLRKRLSQAFDLLDEFSDEKSAARAVKSKSVSADKQVLEILRSVGAFESESRHRILERLEDAKLSFDQAPVFTIHGFCNQVLQQLVFETGSRFQFELLTSQEPLVEEAVQDFVARYWTDPRSSMAQWLPLSGDLWKQFHDVAKKAVDNPADRVVPESAGSVLPQVEEFAKFEARAAELAELWRASRDDIDLLFAAAQRDDVLKQVAHKPEQVAEALKFVDDFVNAPSPFEFKWNESGKLESLYARLTQSRLSESTKKGKEGREPQHPCFELYEEVTSLAQEIQAKAEHVRVAMLSKLAEFTRQHVAQHKDKHGTLTFSDMLHLVDEALGRPDRQSLKTSLREHYRVAMVDEFQDTDPVQFRIFRRIFLEGDAVSSRTRESSDLRDEDGSLTTSATTESKLDEVVAQNDDEDADPFGDPSSFYDDIPDEVPGFYDEPLAADRDESPEPQSLADETLLEQTDFRAFVMIGDPKQSIYKFRGADLSAYLSAIADVPDSHRHQMDRNWRSDDSLVRAVQQFFQSAENPFLSEKIDLPPVTAQFPDRFTAGPAFEVRVVPRGDDEQSKSLNKDVATSRVLEEVAADIVRKINAKLPMPDEAGSRPVKPGDIAVLGRTRKHLIEMQAALATRGVPAVLHVDESVYASAEAVEVSQMLRAILQASGARHLATALRTSFCGLVASEIEHVLHDDNALAVWSEKLREWNSLWQRAGFIVMWRRLLEEQQVIPRLAGTLGGERQITNLLHLGELLHQQAVEQHAGPEELLRWFDHMRQDEDRSNEAAQLRLETDSESVQLITIHKSKGLEYGIVYCPTLWDERDIDRDKKKVQVLSSRQGGNKAPLDAPELDVGSDLLPDRREWDADEQFAEQRRLLYVALTRARHQCVLHWVAANGMSKSAASAFLSPDWDEKGDDATLSTQLLDWAASLNVPRVRIMTAQQVATLDDPGMSEWAAARPKGLECRPVLREELPAKWQTSYSALVRMLPVHAQHEWTDRDEILPDAESTTPAPKSGDRTPLAEMPGGTRVGDVVHRVLESVLLKRPEVRGLSAAMERALAPEMRRAALDQRWLEPLAATMTATLNARIDALDPPARLLDVPQADIACELPFVLRLGRSGGADGTNDASLAFDLGQLAECFAQARQPFVREYAERVRGLDQGRINGLLVGFIDVVFCWRGRWYVVDYKTTNLGPRFSDYSTERLTAAMADHDYLLQYHLYSVAVSQFLKQRLPDFDPARDFGGVLYFFLRGVDPHSKQLGGVFFDRPEPELIASIGQTLNGAER